MNQKTSMSPNVIRKKLMLKAAEIEETLNKNTKTAYSRIWQSFIDYIDEYEITGFEQIDKDIIVKFLFMQNSKPAAYNQQRSAVFRLLTEVVDDDVGSIPKLESLKRKISSKKIPAPDKLSITKSELDQARDNAHALFDDRRIRIRNILIFDLIRYTLMRADEIALIQLVDINIQGKKIAVRGKGSAHDAKGGRVVSDYIPIKPALLASIKDYVDNWRMACDTDQTRPSLSNHMTVYAGMPLLTSQKGNKLDVSTIKKAISDMVAQIYIDQDKPVPPNHGPHCIRRSMAKISYKSHKDILLTQRMLRHASIETTRIYLEIDQEEMERGFMMLG